RVARGAAARRPTSTRATGRRSPRSVRRRGPGPPAVGAWRAAATATAAPAAVDPRDAAPIAALRAAPRPGSARARARGCPDCAR
ncbi:MAG: hypothetical protein D6689_21820, partial [Deltaproteobacteria bacterium]